MEEPADIVWNEVCNGVPPVEGYYRFDVKPRDIRCHIHVKTTIDGR